MHKYLYNIAQNQEMRGFPLKIAHEFGDLLSLVMEVIIIWVLHNLRVDSRLVSSQWETSLKSNAVSHWLGANLESAL